jgi:hypothetical protein
VLPAEDKMYRLLYRRSQSSNVTALLLRAALVSFSFCPSFYCPVLFLAGYLYLASAHNRINYVGGREFCFYKDNMTHDLCS